MALDQSWTTSGSACGVAAHVPSRETSFRTPARVRGAISNARSTPDRAQRVHGLARASVEGLQSKIIEAVGALVEWRRSCGRITLVPSLRLPLELAQLSPALAALSRLPRRVQGLVEWYGRFPVLSQPVHAGSSMTSAHQHRGRRWWRSLSTRRKSSRSARSS